MNKIIFCLLKFAPLYTLYSIFNSTANKFPGNPALWVNNDFYSYSELRQKSEHIGAILQGFHGERVGLLASKSITAYSGVLGILAAGKAYVPLNPKFPDARNATIIKLAKVESIVVGSECLSTISLLAELIDDKVVLIFPENSEDEIEDNVKNTHTCYYLDQSELPAIEPNKNGDLAYILFTSGSTGTPKGVPISQKSVIDYVTYLSNRYKPTPKDRFSQTFDLTFDLSVHDLFLCWNAGACLYSIPEKSVLGPGKFIKDHQLTFWFSVPSVLQFMNTFKMLKPGNFPSLRVSLFCGEPLPVDICIKWQAATLHQICENIYGPTETTIGISHYSIPNEPEKIKSRNGIVCIGNIFTTQRFQIEANADGNGELLLGGTQLSPGYWENELKTSEVFITDQNGKKWYRTGDLVDIDTDGDLFYLGRKDFQVKIRGYRIELEEINHALTKCTGESLVFSMPWPVKDGIAQGVVSFITSKVKQSKEEIINQLSSVLPEYMIPSNIMFVENFPLNSNGKIDKLELVKNLT